MEPRDDGRISRIRSEERNGAAGGSSLTGNVVADEHEFGGLGSRTARRGCERHSIRPQIHFDGPVKRPFFRAGFGPQLTIAFKPLPISRFSFPILGRADQPRWVIVTHLPYPTRGERQRCRAPAQPRSTTIVEP